LLTAAAALAQSPPVGNSAAVAPRCVVHSEEARFDLPLARVAARLSGGQPIKIVAIGSSSTYGAGASSPAKSYPSQLEVELKRHFPGHPLTVLNRGINGEEAGEMLARFQTGVIAERPHLVLWQVGTNSVLRGRPIDPHVEVFEDGIARLKAIRADVVLVNPQFAPKVIAKSEAESMVDLISATAKAEKVDLFDRFALMRRWHDVQHLSFDTFVSPDGLHMNDWSYGCLARWLGVEIADAATRPTAAVATRRPAR
jgi:lysophospholipase L1-like esterase